MTRAAAITESHKQDLIKLGTEHITWRFFEWESVVFSNGKKRNLDGMDGFPYH